jgi:hypothetical protein
MMAEKNLVVLTLGYMEVIMPLDTAVSVLRGVNEGGCRKLDSKWISEKRESWECLEKIEVSIRAFPEERVALAKLNTQAYEEYKREQEAAK